VIERVRSKRPSTRIIVCSGHVEEELVRRGIRTGELAYVRKPFTSAQLIASVRDALASSPGEA
jgi:DNA-binding NarL/FixJ family response regulator